MKILQLAKYYPPIYGGIELVEKMMTKAHRENDDEVFVWAFSHKNAIDVGEFNEQIFRKKENFKILSTPANFDYVFSFKNFILTYQIERIYVHLPNPFMHEAIVWHHRFLKNLNIEIIAVYHSDIVNKSFLGECYNWYFKKTLYVYDKIIVSSENLWDSSGILNNEDKNKRVTIPFCIEELPVKKRERNFNNKLISIGRLVPYKGFEFLIRTINDTNFELHIVGDGPLYKKLKNISSSNIIFHKNLSHIEKNNLLADSGVMVVGSINRAEAYGMSIVESFSMSIPVIAPRLNTGVNFLVQHGITGLEYSVKDSKSFLENLNKLKDDTDFYERISESCNNFYNDNLTFENFKNRLISI